MTTVENYDEVQHFPLDPEILEQILKEQNECTFIWGPKDHWAVGVIMSYVWLDGSFWLTATNQRKRISAIRRDPRISLAISSVGTRFGPAKSITVKGRVEIHDDEKTLDRMLPVLAGAILPGADELQVKFVKMMESERRLVLEVTPEKWITFDAAAMMAASILQPSA